MIDQAFFVTVTAPVAKFPLNCRASWFAAPPFRTHLQTVDDEETVQYVLVVGCCDVVPPRFFQAAAVIVIVNVNFDVVQTCP